MLAVLLIIIHLVVCLGLILIILLQTTKGAGMGAAFGGASQTLFGATGRATFLTKLTITAAVIFSLTSISLSFIWTEKGSVAEDIKPGAFPGVLPPLTPPSTPGADAGVPGGPLPLSPDDGLPDLSVEPPPPSAPATEHPAETPALPPLPSPDDANP